MSSSLEQETEAWPEAEPEISTWSSATPQTGSSRTAVSRTGSSRTVVPQTGKLIPHTNTFYYPVELTDTRIPVLQPGTSSVPQTDTFYAATEQTNSQIPLPQSGTHSVPQAGTFYAAAEQTNKQIPIPQSGTRSVPQTGMPGAVSRTGTSSDLQKRIDKLSSSSQTSPYIFRAPRQFSLVNNKAYEPENVAIGPYRNFYPQYKMTEELKLRYLDSLLRRIPETRLEKYVSAMTIIERRARDCYVVPCVTITPKKYVDMLVLNGCFIIEVIRFPTLLELSFPVRSGRRTLQRDLIVLENQIPFFVLCKLFDLIEGPGQHISLMNLVLQFFKDAFPGNVSYPATAMRSSGEVKHILDLVYHHFCSPSSYNRRQVTIQGSKHIASRRIPCASQLENANVKFRNKKRGSDSSLFDVEFTSGGELVMPTLVIDDWTESWLRNLIAYEQFLPKGDPTPVTDYAFLLDCLIDTSKDVQILSDYKIIENMMGSNVAVSTFVNKLTDRVMFYEDNFMYADTFSRINSHYRKLWNRALASFNKEYFSSLWAYFAFSGALLLLGLTIAQTVLSAIFH